MGDNLTILGRNYTNVVGIKATQTNNGQLAYIRPTGTYSITQNGTENVAQYEYVDVDVQFTPNLEDRTVNYTPSASAQSDTVTQTDPGYDGLGEVTVNIAAMPAGTEGTPTVQVSKSSGVATITPSVTNSAGYIAASAPIVGTPVQVTGAELATGTLTISQSGETNVAGYEKVSIPLRVPGNDSDSEYYTSSGARKWRYRPKTTVPLSGWVNNGTVNGFWVPFDAIPTGTSITPIESAQTIGGANTMMEGAVTVDAISSSYVGSAIDRRDSTDLTASGAIVGVPSGYYENNASKAIANGIATAPASIAANGASVVVAQVQGSPRVGFSKTVSVTPSVTTAGYISAGTAGNSDVTLFSDIIPKAAATYHPSTSDQTIASGTYIGGAQTIKAVTLANLTAGNIKKDVVVKIGDSTDDECVASVTGTYEGGGSSKNVQILQSTTRAASSSYTKICGDITVAKTGTYDVYWSGFRSSTSGTSGSQLHIGNTAYGNAQTSFTNHVQNVHLSNVSLTANQKISVYGRSRGSNYYMYVGELIIIES